MWAAEGAAHATGTARRRRERRLRAYLRYARMSVEMALAECQHHSAQRPKKARAREEEREMHFTAAFRTTVPVVQILDVPVPQKGEELANILKPVDTQTPAEQVIAVPKIFNFSIQPRSVVRCPLMAEQLVEVPTVVSFAVLQQHIAEQIIDIPGRGGGGGQGGLQGSSSDRIQQHGFLSRTLTFKFLVVVVVREVFKVLTQDRVQQLGFRSGSSTLLIVEALKVFSQDRVCFSALLSRSLKFLFLRWRSLNP